MYLVIYKDGRTELFNNKATFKDHEDIAHVTLVNDAQWDIVKLVKAEASDFAKPGFGSLLLQVLREKRVGVFSEAATAYNH